MRGDGAIEDVDEDIPPQDGRVVGDDDDDCWCQNRWISGRGSRTVRLRSMVTRGGGHDVYPGSGPLDGGNTLLPC